MATDPEIVMSEPVDESAREPERKPRRARLTLPSAEENPKKKSGRPKKKKAASTVTLTIDDIQAQILGMHALAAVWIPEITISEEAARGEAVAIKRVLDIYGMAWMERVEPWIALGIAVAIGETPSILAVKNRIAQAQQAKAAEKTAAPPIPFNPQQEVQD